MRALVTGATGFVGQALVARLESAVVVSRDAERARQLFPRAEVFAWQPQREPVPAEALRDVDVVFNLAGDSIGQGRWTAAKKRRLVDSRIETTRNLVRGLQQAEPRPRVLVSASAIGYYGSRGDEWLDEQTAPGSDFLADLCAAWEQAALSARELGVRVVNPRIGVVLGAGGGALAQMLTPFKLGLGGRLGSGKQWMSWIHLDDLVGLLLHAATHDTIDGPMNATAPTPVVNAEFTRVLAGVLHRPAIFPAPAPMLRLVLGEFAEVLLGSQRVRPAIAEQWGYTFRWPQLEPALHEILDR